MNSPKQSNNSESTAFVGRIIKSFQIPDPKESVPNVIITGRYNIFTFFPQNLFEQFRRLANVYFLVLGIIAAVGEYTNYYETAVQAVGILTPVSAVVLISMIKDGVEDVKRHRTDARVNARPVLRVNNSNTPTIETAQWRDLYPGDIIILFNGDEVPADAIVLSSGGIQGPICYVETAAIDGESNLKPRSPCLTMSKQGREAKDEGKAPDNAVSLAENKQTIQGIPCLQSVIANVEDPNEIIDSFNGSITYRVGEHQKEQTLTKDNLLLRGCILRASEWTIAMITYAGAETKLSLNSKKPPSKLSAVDRIVNRTLIIAMSCMLCVCIVSMICEIGWVVSNQHADYLCLKSTSLSSEFPRGGGCNSSMPNSGLTIFTFATLYNNFVCISMYVSLEMVYLCQAYFISQDLQVYDAETDTPAECHSIGMCADLGQVQYVMSDKTGTLTKNVMKLRRISVTGRKYGAPIVLGGRLAAAASPPESQHVPRRSSAFVRADRSECKRASAGVGGGAEFDYNLFRTSEGDIWLPLHELATHSSVEATLANASSSEAEDEGYLQELASDATEISDFLRVLVVCNTVILMPDEHGKNAVGNLVELTKRLQAESPDEVALVSAAAEYGGHMLIRRYEGGMTFRRLNAGTEASFASSDHEVSVLAINAFDSDRKRMSVVVCVDGRYMLLVKGADSSVLPLCQQSRYKDDCEKHIETFASTGLRTLVVAQRELDAKEATDWLKHYDSASKLIVNRAEQLKYCALAIEHTFDLLGAVGIEDELQEGVPQAISTLLEMGLNVWMITGDKAETAVAISQQCDLLSQNHFMEKLLGLSGEALRQRVLDLDAYFRPQTRELSVGDSCFALSIGALEDSQRTSVTGGLFPASILRPSESTGPKFSHTGARASHSSFNKSIGAVVQPLLTSGPSISAQKESGVEAPKKLALIVDGSSLEAIWALEDIKERFTNVVRNIPTVIACRVSPKQKAALVHMIKTGKGSPITLAIGDGANDVGMINEARIGIGIAGKEGRHAANSSDFAIGQFRFIVPLMLEHGRYNYIRCCKLVLYSFFKNLLLVSVLFYFCTYSGYSGTVPLDSIIFSGYNFYLGLPIIALGALDLDVPKDIIKKFPFLAYKTGRCSELLNLKTMFIWCTIAFLNGYLLFAVALRMVSGEDTVVGSHFEIYLNGPGLNNPFGQSAGLFEVGFLLYSCIFISMQNKVMIMTTSRTWINWSLWVLSTLGYFGFTWVYGVSPSIDWFNVVPIAFSCVEYWLALILVPIILALSDIVLDSFTSYVSPSSVDLLQAEVSKAERALVALSAAPQKTSINSVRLNGKFDLRDLEQNGTGNKRVGFKTSDAGMGDVLNPVPIRASDASTVTSEVSQHIAHVPNCDLRASFGMVSSSFEQEIIR